MNENQINELVLKLDESGHVLLPIDDLEIVVNLLGRNALLLRDYTHLEDAMRMIKYVLQCEIEKRNKLTQASFKEVYES